MLAYIIRRVIMLIPIILGVTFLVFISMHLLPGDAVDKMLAETGASAEDLARLREQLGLDDPFYVQYGRFLKGAIRGDFGHSLYTRRSVMEQISVQFPATMELALTSLVIALLLGVSLGIVAAVRRGSWADTVTMAFALAGVSVPIFWIGIIMIFVFSLRLGWLPSGGTGGIAKLIMPALSLAFSSMGILARVTRSSMLEVLGTDYIRTARAKGLSERVIQTKHALRNALIPVITLAGLQVGYMLGGAVLTETVFSRQGLGYMAAEAVQRQDFPLVQGTVTVIVVIFMVANLLVDLSYGFLDPRVRYG